ncbi:putative interleukin-17 receptor E-like isoform X1 [Arapaima gigas]
MKPAVLLTLAVCGVVTRGDRVERIQECKLQCAKVTESSSTAGLALKSKSSFVSWSFRFCESPAEPLIGSAIQSVNISTVMKCEGRHRCSLQLSLTSLIQISERLRSLAVCLIFPGTLKSCEAVVFRKRTREKLSGQKVEVHHSCFGVRPDQQVQVSLSTLPGCSIWSQVYQVQGCQDDDLRENVPDCITGKISYSVDEERRRLTVSVSDALEDKDYYLRLCHKAFVCTGIGKHVLLKKDNPNKTATFLYPRAVPCLCIEGWSSMVDARRTQVCPFVNRTAELWHGVTFDPETEMLSWEPACPVRVVVTLCQSAGDHLCQDLVNSSQEVLSRKKVVYSKVDAHPDLCVKFTTDVGSWIRCPFLNWTPAWSLTLTSAPGRPQAHLASRIRAELLLSLCRAADNDTCDSLALVSMEKSQAVAVNLTADVCRPGVCVQVKRADADFSPRLLLCDFQRSEDLPARKNSDPEDVFWMLLLAAVYLAVALLVLLTGGVVLKIYNKKR